MGAVVEIVPYDPEWPIIYVQIKTDLRRLLKGRVSSIHHVGSTSVSGLAAKPFIDVDVVLTEQHHMDECRMLLEAHSYEPRGSHYGDGVWAFMMKTPLPGRRIYLCPPDSATHDKRLRFRNALRKDRSIADAYSALKRELAAAYRYDGDGYTSAKTSFIETVLNNT